MSEEFFLSIIVPAYNEDRYIEGTLSDIAGYLKNKAFDSEVMVIDDGSEDSTARLAQSASPLFKNFRLLKNGRNRGKGYSVRNGLLAAKGKYALFMDADSSTSIYELDKFLEYLEEGYDVVIASRRLDLSIVEERQPLLRDKMGKFYIYLSRMMLGLKVNDFNCGFKAYNIKRSRFIFDLQKMEDWSFDVELLFLIDKYGLKIKETPVRWAHKTGSKVKPVKDAVRSLISLIRIKMNDMTYKYQ